MLKAFSDMFLDGITLKEVEKKLNTKFVVVKDIYSTKEIVDFIKLCSKK